MTPTLRLPLIMLSAAALACAPTPDPARDSRADPTAPPDLSLNGFFVISGTILGPDGTHLCDFLQLPPGASQFVRVIDPVNATPAFTQNVACPDATYDVTVPSGTYRVRLQLPANPIIGDLPWRHLEPGEVVVSDADVVQDLHLQNALPLGGGATVDGAPFAGVTLNIIYDFPGFTQFAAAQGASGADGAWDDFFRSPMLLQSGPRYRASLDCRALGTTTVTSSPTSPFVFPSDASAVTCELATGTGPAYTHVRTRLVTTPGPGDIGGLCNPIPGDPAIGFGVQFPTTPGGPPPRAPVSASHIFCGGLLIGVAPDVVLSSSNIGGYLLECVGPCQDLGQDATLKVKDEQSGGKRVTWTYSDAASAERVGLRITQRSFDGRLPADYVLFRFTLKNTGRNTKTVHFGFFGDWDVDDDAFEDEGATDLGGRLMYAHSTSPFDRGTFVGTLLLGAPPSGSFFFAGSNPATRPQTIADQLAALSGAITRPSFGPADIQNIHAVGPITLRRDSEQEVWLAVVAGEDLSQLLANAAAAEADVARRRQESDVVLGAETETTLPQVTRPATARAAMVKGRAIVK